MSSAMQAKSTAATHLGEDFDALMSQAVGAKGVAVSCEDMRNSFFGSYIDSTKAPEERSYAEVANVMGLISIMEGYLVDHNGQNLHFTHALHNHHQQSIHFDTKSGQAVYLCSATHAIFSGGALHTALLELNRLYCNMQA